MKFTMKKKNLFLVLFLTIQCITFSQSKKEVLFTINQNPYYTDEFLRVYNKNIDLVKDESQKDLNQYLELFVGYKLKINKANKLGLQNNPKYVSELASYRTQLAKNYTSDIKVTQALIEEAYNRSLKEVRAAHILFMVDENAAPEDTLRVYKQAIEVRKRILNGEKFEDLAVQFSQDPSAKENKGDLGYFSAFRMVYAFESAAFKTPVGSISMPVRTRFGYHLVKVIDLRNNRGDLTIAHIMINKPNTDSKDDDIKAENNINDIYKKLQQGESFESLAKQFSEDKNSAPKGGVLPRFSSGQLSSEEFENAAFALQNLNDYSKPVKTQFGWHIIKLIEKHPIKELKEVEKELDSKIRRDDRSRLISNSLTQKLRKKYAIKTNDKIYKLVQKTVNDSIYKAEWKQPKDKKPFEVSLLKIDAKKDINASLFLNEIESQQKNKYQIKPIEKVVDKIYNIFIDNQLTTYYNENLENEFPEFAHVYEEYRDGLLLFDLMEKEIWEKAKTDSIGLQQFFNKNNANYVWKKRVEVISASSVKEEFVKKALEMLANGKSIEQIKTELNTKDVVNIMFKQEFFEENASNLPKNVSFKTGITKIDNESNTFVGHQILKVLPAGPKLLTEAKGKAINDYQQFLEDNWVNNLKQEFQIKINNDVFEKIKASQKK